MTEFQTTHRTLGHLCGGLKRRTRATSLGALLLTSLAVLHLVSACTPATEPAPSPTSHPGMPTASPTNRPAPDAISTPPVELQPVLIEPAAGSYDGVVSVSLSSPADGVVIRYTLDGSEPSESHGLVYEGPFHVTDSSTVTAAAFDDAGNRSMPAIVAFVVNHPRLDPPVVQLEQGVHIGTKMVEITSGEPGASIVFTLDGSAPSASHGEVYEAPIRIDRPSTLKAVAVLDGYETSDVASTRFWVYASETVSTEDIVLSGDEVLTIEDMYFAHRGNIKLEDNAQLIIRDSMVLFDKDYSFQFSLEATDSARVTVENSSIANECTGSFNWAFFDDSSLTASRVDHAPEIACNTWNFMSGNSSVDVTNWYGFSGTVCDGSQAALRDSGNLEVEFCLPDGLTIDRSFPLQLDHFEFGSADDPKMQFNLTVDNSWVDGWGLNLLPGSDITIRDTPSVTFGIIAGNPWVGQTVEVSGLRFGLIEDQTWEVGDARLRLVNTYVYGWEPNAFGTTTIVVRDSEFATSSVNSADGRYIIEDSRMGMLRAAERVQMTVRRSEITGDVIATDDTVITLVDCVVVGNLYASGNGMIVILNTSVDGELNESENGQITEQESPA